MSRYKQRLNLEREKVYIYIYIYTEKNESIIDDVTIMIE
jgi:hypothetical protein